MSFEQFAQEYFDKGLVVVPITPGHKAPLVKDWNNIDFEQCIDKYKGWGIGIKPGASGLMALDLDIEDEEKKKKIKEILPPIYCGRIGNKNRLPTIFFKYDKKFEDIKEAGIELIINARQCVLPPTMHPNGYPYEWVGVDLLAADMELIPELDPVLLQSIIAVASEGLKKNFKGKIEIIPSDGTRSNHFSYDKLSQVVVAMVMEQKSFVEISDRLLEIDREINPKISFFNCPSRKEWKVPDINLNCSKFIVDTFEKKIKKNPEMKMYIHERVIEFIGESMPKRERMKLPKLRGIAQDMFEYIYNNSPVPRSQFAFASAISTMSVILGNRIKLNNVFPNLYTLMLAPSGYGKDFPLNFPVELLYQADLTELIGEGHPSSDTGIMMNLPHQRVRIDVIDEADILFSAINSTNTSYLAKMSDEYAKLYTSAGKYYSGKNTANKQDKNNVYGNTGACHSPYVSILAAMTLKALSNSFRPDTIEKGLGGRFLYFIEEKQKDPRQILDETPEIPNHILKFAKMWRSAGFGINLGESPDRTAKVNIEKAKVTDRAKDALLSAGDWVINERKRVGMNNRIYPIYNRAYVMIQKMALIDACSIQSETMDVIIRHENVVWAQKFVEVHLNNMHDMIETYISENGIEKTSNDVYNIIKSNGGEMSLSELTRRTRKLTANQRNSILNDLVVSGMLTEHPLESSGGRRSKIYKSN